MSVGQFLQLLIFFKWFFESALRSFKYKILTLNIKTAKIKKKIIQCLLKLFRQIGIDKIKQSQLESLVKVSLFLQYQSPSPAFNLWHRASKKRWYDFLCSLYVFGIWRPIQLSEVLLQEV
jgi:hypothetical protein